MLFILAIILAIAAGALLGYIVIPEIETTLDYNKYVLLILIVVLFFVSIFVATTIQYNERAKTNSTSIQKVDLHWCIFEDKQNCQNEVNMLNAANYNYYQQGKTSTVTLHIALSLIDNIYNNIVTYFVIGLLLSWTFVFGRDIIGK